MSDSTYKIINGKLSAIQPNGYENINKPKPTFKEKKHIIAQELC